MIMMLYNALLINWRDAMQNLKVKVNSAEESREVQELFFKLGGVPHKDNQNRVGLVILADNTVCADFSHFEDFYTRTYSLKEITIPQLKDMVVLKRNNVSDATHNTHKCGALGFLTSDNAEYMWDYSIKKWTQNRAWSFHKYEMKPIQNNDLPFIDSEKDVKEYLEPMPNGDYRYHIDDGFSIGGDWIEIPEGAVKAYLNHSKSINFVNSDDDYMNGVTNGEWVSTHRGLHEKCGHILVWQRQPQEESINEKLASAEEARQKHSHYKKDVSHLDFIDVYRVLDLFEVESHAVGHAVKKLLCSGQRGAKDKAQDIQEAIDSLNRELDMVREDESNG